MDGALPSTENGALKHARATTVACFLLIEKGTRGKARQMCIDVKTVKMTSTGRDGVVGQTMSFSHDIEQKASPPSCVHPRTTTNRDKPGEKDRCGSTTIP